MLFLISTWLTLYHPVWILLILLVTLIFAYITSFSIKFRQEKLKECSLRILHVDSRRCQGGEKLCIKAAGEEETEKSGEKTALPAPEIKATDLAEEEKDEPLLPSGDAALAPVPVAGAAVAAVADVHIGDKA
ncbi:MAG: hypothetical protein P4M11_13925 [Candidatus Pacebacteria bacterium]|nr:hypothetical protein [Candidatus Paceibacterota bacterium]